MSEIILWSLLAFFGAFGLVEFIRFVYTDWNSTSEDYHVVVCADKAGENLESVVRNTILSTDTLSVIVLSDNRAENEVLEKLKNKYSYLEIMKTEEYIDFLKK